MFKCMFTNDRFSAVTECMFLHNRLTSSDVIGRRTWQFPAVHVMIKAEYIFLEVIPPNGGLIFEVSPIFPANLLHSDNGK